MKKYLCLAFSLFFCGSVHADILLEDDFNDNVIDTSKWYYQGNRVVEEEGIIKVENTVIDEPGNLYAEVAILNTIEPITIERRVKAHYANDKFSAGLTISPLEAPEKAISVRYIHFSYDCTRDGFYLFRDGGYYACGHEDRMSDRIAPVWDEWFNEKIIYDPVSGLLSYFINDLLQMEYDVGSLPGNVTELVFRFNSWGWYTGHYQYLDDVEVSQDPVIPPCAGSVVASTYQTSPVYSSSELTKHLAYFLLPIGAVLGLAVWRRKR